MGLIHIFIILIGLILLSSSREFSPTPVSSIVNEILHDYDDYVHYNGSGVSVPAFAIQAGAVSGLEPRDMPYWYEQIPHRGISAFGPAGYQVYRNVRDYGARGSHTPIEIIT